MKEHLFDILCASFIGVLGVGIWYAEMFTDSKAANLWRRMNGQGRISKNWAAIGSPALSSIAFIYILGTLIEKHAPDWLTFSLACLMMLLLLIILIGLLPIKFPRWVYADWQYAKRHGLLDENGNIDQEAYENHADRKEFW
nr:hypothetical protein [Schaalia odontolytica]